MANTPYYTKAEIEAKYAAGGKIVSEEFNQVLQFNRNKYSATAISQSGAIAFSLASSNNIDGVVIRHKIMSDGTNPITFGSEFNVFGKPENDIYPSGLHIFYFNYVGGDVDVVIPTYAVTSSGGGSTNTSPTTNADSYTVDENQTLTVNAANGVLANDNDNEGDSLTASVVSGVSNGTLNFNSDGSFTYTPNTDYTGSDSFTYKTNDGTVVGNTATVSITVNNVAVATTSYDAVWTLDKIDNPSYAGASIRITQDNGSTFRDIGFDGDNLDVADIEQFAAIAYVDKIYDKTGNGNHFEFSAGSRPFIKPLSEPVITKGGKPAIKFENINTNLLAPNTLTAENGLTLIAVHYNDTISGSNKGIVGKWDGTGNEYGLLSRHFASPNDVSFISQNGSSLQNNLQSGTTLGAKALRLLTATYNPATSTKSIRINGTETVTATGDIRASDAPLIVGGYTDASDTNEAMFISEIRLAKAFDSNISTLESSIKTKYGI